MLVEHKEPWLYYTIDNFLDNDLFKKLVSLRHHKNFKFVDCWDGKITLTKHNSLYPSKNNLDLYNDPQLVKLIDANVRQQLSSILPSNFFCIPDLIKCDPNYLYPRHIDHPSKLFSIIVYLHPQKSNATVLLHNDKKVFVDWKSNRALIIKNDPHTHHYYHNSTEYPRLTLNVYITQDSNQPFNVTPSEP